MAATAAESSVEYLHDDGIAAAAAAAARVGENSQVKMAKFISKFISSFYSSSTILMAGSHFVFPP